jgi:hypothetical protein
VNAHIARQSAGSIIIARQSADSIIIARQSAGSIIIARQSAGSIIIARQSAGSIIHKQFTAQCKLPNGNTQPYCRYKPESVLESANMMLYWDRCIITDVTVDFDMIYSHRCRE